MRKGGGRRSIRLAEEIKRELASMLTTDMSDPRFDLVSVSGVSLNSDFSIAKVYYTLSGDEEKLREVAAALEKAKGALRSGMGKRLRLRFVPELKFERDEYLETMIYGQPESSDL